MAKSFDSTIIYNKAPAGFSANRWLDASVTGNGKVGAAILGAYSAEEILINHAGLKWHGYTGVLQDVSDKFPNVRKLYNDAKLFDAEKLLEREFEKKGYKPSPDSPLPLCVFSLNFVNEGFVTDYERTTDMKSGEVSVNFKAGSTYVKRSLFISRNTDILAYNVSKTGPDKINVSISVNPLGGAELQNIVTKYEGGFIYYSARGTNGLDYGIVVRVITSTGTAEVKQSGISVKNSDGLTIFAKTFVASSRETEFKSLKNELAGIKLNYDKMQAQSETAHKKLFQEVTLDLAKEGKNDEMSALVDLASNAQLDADLLERMWNFGKYLVICGGGELMTPSGLWCGDYKVANGFLTFNNTAQLLYGGLTAMVSPDKLLDLFGFLEKYVDDLKKNAARVYGAKGYVVPNCFSPDSALFGFTDAKTLHFVASSALAANLCFNYFLVTQDIKTLKSKIFPFMREVSDFYSDLLKLDSSGYYSTVPSYSPDSTPGNVISGKPLDKFAFATNSTIDFLAIGTLLENLIASAKICNQFLDEIPTWQDMQTKIPPFSVTDSGNLREYTNSAFIDGANNCGCLHSYGLYPLKTFSFNDVSVMLPVSGTTMPASISLKKASSNAIITRLSRASNMQNASTLAMYTIQMAHAGEGGFVKNLLLRLTAACTTASGLMLTNDWRGSGMTKTASVNLDISGNIGFATAITECLVQSNASTLKILPTIFAEISQGQIKDVVTDFGARVSLEWNVQKSRCSIRIQPKTTCRIDIIMNPTFKKCKNKELNFDTDFGTIRNLQLTAGKLVTIDF